MQRFVFLSPGSFGRSLGDRQSPLPAEKRHNLGGKGRRATPELSYTARSVTGKEIKYNTTTCVDSQDAMGEVLTSLPCTQDMAEAIGKRDG